ncbi:beta-lactamase class A [Peribacillus simplex]|uniref:Beta-lactamase class A n=1 Tax=Peribacillus simplex TaxID=1478 RepID=A0A9X8WNI8_9BACI|nr:serine hydrolase [Peribacillus simplex]SIS13081.1 beta-lactamase class A [Peribacillus simplex]
MGLQDRLEEVIQDATGTFGVYVKHLESGETAAINENRFFQAASVFKIPILAALYRDVEIGKVRLQERIRLEEVDLVNGSGIFKELIPGIDVTIKNLATMMIIVSDNVGTDKLLNILGKENVNQFMKEVGLNNTYIRFSCWELLCACVGIPPQSFSLGVYNDLNLRFKKGEIDHNSIVFKESIANNVTTASDMALLLERIAYKQLISEKACDDMFEILAKQQFRSRIPYLLPQNTVVAHKTGTIASVVNDSGIVQLPDNKGRFIITAFSIGNKTEAEGAGIISELARVAYNHFLNKVTV